MARNAKRKRASLGQSMGGMLAGFDDQVFRTTPPPHELVEKAAPIRGVSGEDGTELELTFPDDTVQVGDPESPGSDGSVGGDRLVGDQLERT